MEWRQVTKGASSSDRQIAVADRLAMLHFTMQNVETAADLQDVEVMALDPALRSLLFTDGTVTRALEVQTLSRVAVDVVHQSPAPAPARAAHCLEVKEATICLRRRVVMRIAARTTPTVWAESYIVPERLPADFVGTLDSTPHGIGGSLEQMRLECRRELLWFRLGASPRWAHAPTAPVTALVRAYRIIAKGSPVLLISEAFAVEMRSNFYHLAGATDNRAASANGSAPTSAVGSGL